MVTFMAIISQKYFQTTLVMRDTDNPKWTASKGPNALELKELEEKVQGTAIISILMGSVTFYV